MYRRGINTLQLFVAFKYYQASNNTKTDFMTSQMRTIQVIEVYEKTTF